MADGEQLAQAQLPGSSMRQYCFYRHDGPVDVSRLADLRAMTPDYQFRFWQPGTLLETPPAVEGVTYKIYSAFHRFHVFSNPDYGACILEKAGSPAGHVASVFPRFFRFPFMGADDLQIGATFTVPEARGRRLAPRAILEAVALLGKPGRRFWYLTEQSNTASCRAAEQAGLLLAGYGTREPRLGLSVLSAYRMTAANTASGAAGTGQGIDRQRFQ